MINYFNFKKFGSDYLITNDFGHYAFVPENELLNLIVNKKVSDISLKKELEQQYFLFDSSEQEFSSIAKFLLRNGKNYLFQSTALHIFVVSIYKEISFCHIFKTCCIKASLKYINPSCLVMCRN